MLVSNFSKGMGVDLVPLNSVIDFRVDIANSGDIITSDEIETVFLSINAGIRGKDAFNAFREHEVALRVEPGQVSHENLPVERGNNHRLSQEGFQQGCR